MTTFSVVVESGSCDMRGERWEERAHCGHRHKTIEAALYCMSKLTRYYCRHGRPSGTACRQCHGWASRHETSAKWYNARIHDQDHRRVEEERSR